MIRAAALAILAALLLVSTAAWAAGEAWTATRVRGTVIKLVGDRWEEVARGEILTDATVRTLRSGRISMEDGAIAIDVGPNSVLELDSSPSGSATALRQYLGSLTIAGTGRKGVSLQAGRLVVTRIDGHATLTVNETATSVTVLDGTLSVRGPTGASVDVSAGSYLAADGNTVLLAAAGPDDRPQPNGAGPGNGNGDSRTHRSRSPTTNCCGATPRSSRIRRCISILSCSTNRSGSRIDPARRRPLPVRSKP